MHTDARPDAVAHDLDDRRVRGDAILEGVPQRAGARVGHAHRDPQAITQLLAVQYAAIASVAAATSCTLATTLRSPPSSESTGMPSPAAASSTTTRPPARARSSADTTNTLPTDAPTVSATAAASSIDAPARTASAASHTQQAIPNDDVLVSTSRTGTGASSATRRALFNVPETAEPMWIDRISVAPFAAARSYAAANRPGLGCDVATDGAAPSANRS